MKTLFENEYVLTKELFLEFSKALISKKIKIFSYIFAIISFIAGILSFIVDLNIIFIIIFWFFSLYFIILPLIPYKITGKKLYEQQVAINNYEVLKKTIYCYDNKIEVVSPNGGKTIVFYNNIKKIYKTKNFLILNSDNKVAVLIKKDGFIKGSYEDFERFIFSKAHR